MPAGDTDRAWLAAHVARLTNQHEVHRPEPWQVGDAPQDIEAPLRSEVLPRIGTAVLNGIRWFPSRAPVIGSEIELGAHGVRQELRVSA